MGIDQNAKKELISTINGCAAGDRVCQKKIYTLYYQKMMGVCLRYSKDQDEAKDILHDGFLKVFDSVHKYNFKGSFEGWVRRIIVNTTVDFFRKNKIKSKSLDYEADILDLESWNEQDDTSMFNQFNMQEVMAEIQNLSPAYRTVFNMFVLEEYSHKEIADQLGISVNASKSNLSKAKINLRKVFLEKLAVKSNG
ncbi:MAG: sigma-70 family RNA polymerase sigma factor [Flavobacteriales bacterium]|nr:sigma-70 family RNA polymerase sigma factor [Flavobacteriales bacterium]